jgi:hypothetical protein
LPVYARVGFISNILLSTFVDSIALWCRFVRAGALEDALKNCVRTYHLTLAFSFPIPWIHSNIWEFGHFIVKTRPKAPKS